MLRNLDGICFDHDGERYSVNRVSEARERLRAIINAVTAGAEPDAQTNDPAQYALLKTIQDFPTRARCAALPWATLEGALDNRDDPVRVP